jgi:hypothetical protein
VLAFLKKGGVVIVFIIRIEFKLLICCNITTESSFLSSHVNHITFS